MTTVSSSSSSASIKTTGRRRRKAVADDGHDENKENGHHVNRGHKHAAIDKDGDGFLDDESEGGEINDERAVRAKRRFLRCLSQADGGQQIFAKYPSLIDSVLRLSIHSDDADQRRRPIIPLHLQDNLSKIISLSRSKIKQAGELKGGDCAACLYVAIHLLRAALWAISKTSSKLESVLQLIHHCISKASGLVLKEKAAPEIPVAVCLASFEALLRAFKSYSVHIGDSSTVVFRVQGPTTLIPVLKDRRNDKRSMNFRQAATVVFQSIFCISGIFKAMLISNSNWLSEAEEFGINVSQINDSPIKFILRLYRYSFRPWVQFMIQHSDLDGSQAATDVTSHCKTAFWLLWGASSKLKNRNIPPSHLLLMRQEALLAHVPSINDIPLANISQYVGPELLESICVYAWKAAAFYIQLSQTTILPVGGSSALSVFYKTISPLVDDLTGMGSDMPTAYIEFSVYRSLHTGDWLHLTETERDEEEPDSEISRNTAVHNFCMLALSLRFHLESNSSHTDLDFLHRCDEIMTAFQATLLDSAVPEHDALHYFKVFSMIQLPRVIGQFLRKVTEQEIHATMELQIAATLLTNCMAPFVSDQLIQRYKDEEHPQITEYYDNLVDCHIKSILSLDRLSVELNDPRFESLADQTAVNMSGAFDESTPVDCVEKAAKMLTTIARERSEKGHYNSSASSHTVALHLFHSMDETLAASTFQLPARWSYLSSALQAAHRNEEASLATFMVLRTSLDRENASHNNRSTIPFMLLDLFMSKNVPYLKGETVDNSGVDDGGSKDLFALDDMQRSCLKKFIKLQNGTIQGSTAPDARTTADMQTPRLSPIDVVEILHACGDENFVEAWEMKTQNNFSVEVVIRSCLFAETTSMSQSYCHILILVETLSMLVSAMNDLAGEGGGESTMEILINAYEDIADLTAECIQFVISEYCDGADAPCMIAFYCFATLLLQNSQSVSTNQYAEQLRARLLNKSQLHGSSQNPQTLSPIQECCLHAMKAYSQLCDLQFQPSCTEPELAAEDIVTLCEQVLQQIPDCASASRRMWISSMSIWTLVNLQRRLRLQPQQQHQLYRQSMEISSLLIQFARHTDQEQHTWFQHAAVSEYTSLVDATPCYESLDLPDVFNDESVVANASIVITTEKKLLTVSLTCSGILCLLQQNNESLDVDTLRRHLPHLLKQFQDAESKPNALQSVRIISMWAQSTIQLIMGQLALRDWNFARAIDLFHQCRQQCKSTKTELKRLGTFESSIPFWMSCAAQSLLALLQARHLYCLHRITLFSLRMGNYRGAQSYAKSTIASLVKRYEENIQEWTLAGIIDQWNNEGRGIDLSEVETFLAVETASTSSDTIIRKVSAVSLRNDDESLESCDKDLFQQVKNLILLGDMLYGESTTSSRSHFAPHYKLAHTYIQQTHRAALQESMVPTMDFTNIHNGILLRKVRYLINEGTNSSKSEADNLCKGIIESKSVSSSDLAWAYYYRGLHCLERAKLEGKLQSLWKTASECSTPAQGFVKHKYDGIRKARTHFEHALRHAVLTSDILIRKILRCLAMTNGPDTKCLNSEDSTSYLVLCSIGRLLRCNTAMVLKSCQKSSSRFFEAFDATFHVTDGRQRRFQQFLETIEQTVPRNWSFLGIAITPTGDVLMTSIQRRKGLAGFSVETFCVFPQDHGCAAAYDSIMRPLDTLIDGSQAHLKDMTVYPEKQKVKKEATKKAWWTERSNLDDGLRSLLEDTENMLFRSDEVRKMISGDRNILVDEGCDDLATQFEASMHMNCDVMNESLSANKNENTPLHSDGDKEQKRNELMQLTVPILKERLLEMDVEPSEFRKLRKKEIIDLILVKESARRRQEDTVDLQDIEVIDAKKPVPTTSGPVKSNACLFLILDENLHRFPFEGMPILHNQTVSRMPSLPHVASTLVESEAGNNQDKKVLLAVDPRDATYVLDPDSNLAGTQKRLQPMLDDFGNNKGWNWKGASGVIPPSKFFEKGLRRANGLLMYFGHGGGETCFSRRKVERLMMDATNEDGSACEGQGCRATVILMGCSSGRLASINRKNVQVFDELPLYNEPEGIALSYLMAGSPCVVGNLWDVTDHDIDRYSVKLLDTFLSKEAGKSLATCVAEARSACKMRYIVGCAPVCYGLPVSVKQAGM